MIVLTDESKIPLQVLLKKLIVEMSVKEDMANSLDVVSKTSAETVIYATIIVSILPIVAVYPYLQKYFVKGTMIGGIKE
jgi:putative aldouronate transport system permease protein